MTSVIETSITAIPRIIVDGTVLFSTSVKSSPYWRQISRDLIDRYSHNGTATKLLCNILQLIATRKPAAYPLNSLGQPYNSFTTLKVLNYKLSLLVFGSTIPLIVFILPIFLLYIVDCSLDLLQEPQLLHETSKQYC